MDEPSAEGNKFATLSLSKSDCIRFIQFPEDVYRKIETVIMMKGRPLGMFRKVKSTGSRTLPRDILRYLYDNSRVLTTTINLSEKVGSKDTMLFKKSTIPSPPVDWMVVQCCHSDRIYLHGAGMISIKDFEDILTILEYFEKGSWTHDAYEFCLTGRPWRGHGERVMKARRLILQVAELTDKLGWKTYGTIKQRTDSDDKKICDSWYKFIKPASPAAKSNK
ncbi:hypothetical protein BJ170DRAFT_721176 [Xylariales sp. AK1849]|nr:hypothetical protein BJ170DRAFT_721176 [Xylariales sp. AK1849]